MTNEVKAEIEQELQELLTHASELQTALDQGDLDGVQRHADDAATCAGNIFETCERGS